MSTKKERKVGALYGIGPLGRHGVEIDIHPDSNCIELEVNPGEYDNCPASLYAADAREVARLLVEAADRLEQWQKDGKR